MSRLLPLLLLAACGSRPLVLSGGEYIDAQLGTRVPIAGIVIRDGEIAEIVPTGGTLPDGEVIDVTGQFVLPGLWDMHVHVIGDDHDGTQFFPAFEWERYRASPHKRRDLFANGVTTVRVPGDGDIVLQLRDRLHRREFEGPRLLAAGKMITAVGGHPVGTIFKDNKQTQDSAAYQVSTADEARAAVAKLAEAGVDLVKITYTSGIGRPHEAELVEVATIPEWVDDVVPRLPDEALAAAIEEAHARGLRVATHVDSVAEAITATLAGSDTLEHAVTTEPGEERLYQRFVDAMFARGTCWVPTLTVIDTFASAIRDRRDDLVDFAAARGVRIGAGTDTGFEAIEFGPAIHKEMELLSKLPSIGRAGAIRAATSDAAACAGESDSGRIIKGARADLIVVDGDPLEDLSMLTRPHIKHVIHRGKRVAP